MIKFEKKSKVLVLKRFELFIKLVLSLILVLKLYLKMNFC